MRNSGVINNGGDTTITGCVIGRSERSDHDSAENTGVINNGGTVVITGSVINGEYPD